MALSTTQLQSPQLINAVAMLRFLSHDAMPAQYTLWPCVFRLVLLVCSSQTRCSARMAEHNITQTHNTTPRRQPRDSVDELLAWKPWAGSSQNKSSQSPSADHVTHPGASDSPPSGRIMAPSYKSLIDWLKIIFHFSQYYQQTISKSTLWTIKREPRYFIFHYNPDISWWIFTLYRTDTKLATAP